MIVGSSSEPATIRHRGRGSRQYVALSPRQEHLRGGERDKPVSYKHSTLRGRGATARVQQTGSLQNLRQDGGVGGHAAACDKKADLGHLLSSRKVPASVFYIGSRLLFSTFHSMCFSLTFFTVHGVFPLPCFTALPGRSNP